MTILFENKKHGRHLSPPLQQVDRTFVMQAGRKLAYFAGCDYYRLSSHPAILRAVREGLARYGLSVAASRLTTGNHPLYAQLEEALARFFGAPAAVLTGSGYAANLTAMQALNGAFTHLLMDERAHMSLADAARFFDGRLLRFKHRNSKDLGRQLQTLRGKKRALVLTDGLFASDGEVAPLGEYMKILPPNGMLLVDDAHAAGILGTTGQGTAEYAGAPRERIIQTITLSKALGCYGGAILCEESLREKLVGASAMFAGSTPLPLPLANAALRAMELLRSDTGLRRRLGRNVDYIKTVLRQRGWPVANTPAPIVAVVPRSEAEKEKMRRRLQARGIFPSFIQYPGGPEGGCFRFVISSEHTRKQLDDLLDALKDQGTR